MRSCAVWCASRPDKAIPSILAPDWLFARWRAAFGDGAARAMAAVIAEEPATDVTPRDPADTGLAAELEARRCPGGSLRVGQRGDLAAWPGYAEGRWWVQDAAAAIPARLFGAKPGATALDLCAAPGGKALQLIAAGASVTALDRSSPRLRRLRQALERMDLKAEVVVANAEAWADTRTFDAVLLDAPCSATGTFRRNPDVLWGAKASDIAKLAGVQSRLLDAAATRVAPGGKLIYCVCSLEPEEGEGQVDAFLARHPDFGLDPISPGEGGAPPASLAPRGWLRILPHHLPGGLDGFFVARLRSRPTPQGDVERAAAAVAAVGFGHACHQVADCGLRPARSGARRLRTPSPARPARRVADHQHRAPAIVARPPEEGLQRDVGPVLAHAVQVDARAELLTLAGQAAQAARLDRVGRRHRWCRW